MKETKSSSTRRRKREKNSSLFSVHLKATSPSP